MNDQQGNLKLAFFKGLGAGLARAAEDMKRTRADRHGLLDQTSNTFSFVGTMMASAKENDIVGAKTLHKAMQKGRHAISDADSYLGSLAAGKNYADPARKDFRKSLFTDSKDNYLRTGGKDMYRKVTVPSISAPIKELGMVVTPMWAMNEGFKQMDSIRGKEPQE